MNRRSVRDVAREHFAAETESPFVAGIRRSAATLSLLIGLIAAALAFAVTRGDVTPYAVPGILLMVAGGAFGALAWIKLFDVEISRKFGLGALAATVSGSLLLWLAAALS